MLGIKLFLLIALLLQTSTLELKIGATLPKDDIDEFSTQSLILHSGDLKPSIQKKVAGVSYRIAYESKNNAIVQISTYDSNFQSSDGVRVGSYVEATKEQIIATESSDILGPKTKDGWRTVLGTDFEITVLKNGADERVVLRDKESGSWSVRGAKKRIKKLFAGKQTIKVKVERFSKIKE